MHSEAVKLRSHKRIHKTRVLYSKPIDVKRSTAASLMLRIHQTQSVSFLALDYLRDLSYFHIFSTCSKTYSRQTARVLRRPICIIHPASICVFALTFYVIYSCKTLHSRLVCTPHKNEYKY